MTVAMAYLDFAVRVLIDAGFDAHYVSSFGIGQFKIAEHTFGSLHVSGNELVTISSGGVFVRLDLSDPSFSERLIEVVGLAIRTEDAAHDY